jgi:hypothetical protein
MCRHTLAARSASNYMPYETEWDNFWIKEDIVLKSQKEKCQTKSQGCDPMAVEIFVIIEKKNSRRVCVCDSRKQN